VPNTHVKDGGKTTPATEVRRLLFRARLLVGNMAHVDVSACAVRVLVLRARPQHTPCMCLYLVLKCGAC
jgi:hypothetical protein